MLTKISNRVLLIFIFITQVLSFYLVIKNAKTLTDFEEMGNATMLLAGQCLFLGLLICFNIKNGLKNKDQMPKVLILLLLFIGISSFQVMYKFNDPVMYVKSFVFSGLTYCSFFAGYLMVKNDNTIIRFNIYLYSLFFLFFIVIFPSYYQYQMQYSRIGIVFQDSMYMLMLLPMMLAFPIKVFRYLAVIVITVIIVYGAKRSSIIIMGCAIPVYILINNTIQRKYSSMALIPFLLLGFCYIFLHFMQSNEFAIERFLSISNDEGSGRIEIWSTYIEAICNSDLFSCIFGHGIFGSVDIFSYKKSAHNDVLETLYSLGIIGLVLYVVFVYLILKKSYRLIVARIHFAPTYSVAIVIFLILSAVSMFSTQPSYPIILYSFLGMVYAIDENSSCNILNSSHCRPYSRT